MFTLICQLASKIAMGFHPRTCSRCIILVHAPTNGAHTLCPLSLPYKIAGGKLQLCSKQSSKDRTQRISLTIGGCFKCNTYHVTVLSWLKKIGGEGGGGGGGGEEEEERR